VGAGPYPGGIVPGRGQATRRRDAGPRSRWSRCTRWTRWASTSAR
jgi:hypothetical protein